ncbi:MAG: helix-turn-helix transcriptional regulator [Hyphomicrobium sp.]|nr:helix-turn-helix transcriptional regulator [Hyphomicrobium sp.]
MQKSLHSAKSQRTHSSAESVSTRQRGENIGYGSGALAAEDHSAITSKSISTEYQAGTGPVSFRDTLTSSHVLEELGYDRHVLLRYRNMQFADADSKGMSRSYQVIGSRAASQLFEPLTNRVLQHGRLFDWENEPDALRSCERSCVGEKVPSGHRRISVAFELSSQSTYVCHVSRSSADWPSLNENTLPQLVGALYLMSTQLEAARQHQNTSEADAVCLTAREIETINWCKVGKTYAEVGVILGISSKTVEYHMSNVMRKLSVNDKTSAILAAVSRGIVSL